MTQLDFIIDRNLRKHEISSFSKKGLACLKDCIEDMVAFEKKEWLKQANRETVDNISALNKEISDLTEQVSSLKQQILNSEESADV